MICKSVCPKNNVSSSKMWRFRTCIFACPKISIKKRRMEPILKSVSWNHIALYFVLKKRASSSSNFIFSSSGKRNSQKKKLEKMKTPPLQGPLSRAFLRSALCNIRSLTPPPIGDLMSSFSPTTLVHLFPPVTLGSPHLTEHCNDCSTLQALSMIMVCFWFTNPKRLIGTREKEKNGDRWW